MGGAAGCQLCVRPTAASGSCQGIWTGCAIPCGLSVLILRGARESSGSVLDFAGALAGLFPGVGVGELPSALELGVKLGSLRERTLGKRRVVQARKDYRGEAWTVEKVGQLASVRQETQQLSRSFNAAGSARILLASGSSAPGSP